MKKITLIDKKLAFTISFLFITLLGYSQSPKTYSTPGTFTAPAGVISITVEAWGGGGKGSSSSLVLGGGGGGGGAYAKKDIAVIASNSYTVIVGAGSISNAMLEVTLGLTQMQLS